MPAPVVVQLLQHQRAPGGGDDGGGGQQEMQLLKNFRAPAARGLFARLGGSAVSVHVERRRRKKHFSQCVSTRPRGHLGTKKKLLHQSTALDELYPTVPLSQIVTRGTKYFISKMNLHVWCTNT